MSILAYMSETTKSLEADILPLERTDIAEATAVMKRAFDDDSKRHLNRETGGPPGYDTGEFIATNGFNKAARSFKAVIAGKIVGIIIVFPGKDGNHFLGCMFTEPRLQRSGIGRALVTHVESAFPGKSWTLETPLFATSNHAFYERSCGFKRVGQTESDDAGPQIVYRKERES